MTTRTLLESEPRWAEWAAVRVDAELAGDGLVLDAEDGRGTLDGNVLEPLEGKWVDITCDVIEVAWSTGATRAEGPLVRDEAGSCRVILDNGTGRYDPTDSNGPYAPGGFTRIRPMVGVRVSAAVVDGAGVAGPYVRQWTGFADEWEVAWRPDEPATATVVASDATKILAGSSRIPRTPGVHGESTKANVGRILNDLAWPAGDRDLVGGDEIVTYSYPEANEREGWDDLRLDADYELALMFIAADGRFTWRGRSDVVELAAQDPTMVLGCGPGEWPYRDARIVYDDTSMKNVVTAGGPGRTTQTVRDDGSVATYRERHYERTDLPASTDAALLNWATFLLTISAYPAMRVDEIVWSPLEAGTDADIRAAFAALETMDRLHTFGLVADRPWSSEPYVDELVLRGWQQTVTADDWQARWVTLQTGLFRFLILDDVDAGVLDVMRLGP